MAKSAKRSKREPTSSTPARVTLAGLPSAKKVENDPRVDFLILSLMSAVVPMIEAKCGTMNKRDQNTLKRQIEKAVRGFVGGRSRS